MCSSRKAIAAVVLGTTAGLLTLVLITDFQFGAEHAAILGGLLASFAAIFTTTGKSGCCLRKRKATDADPATATATPIQPVNNTP